MAGTFSEANEMTKNGLLEIKAPKAEAALWARLKETDLNGYRFSREYGVGQLVVDFYCPKLRLVVEIEGAKGPDKKRQAIIEGYGIRFLSCTQTDVLSGIDGVMARISAEITAVPAIRY